MARKSRKTPSQERLKELFHYDPETGVFTRIMDRCKWKAGSVAGTLAGGYVSINVDYCIYRAHRLAWRYMTGDDPPKGVDHINGCGTDNRFCNLRIASHGENMCNKKVQSNNKLGVKGVYRPSPDSTRFVARICIGGKQTHLGCFKTMEEARAAYNAASKIIHGEFGRPSLPLQTASGGQERSGK